MLAIAVVYNGARVALAERARDLASLRVLGFTRAEVSRILLGEMGIEVGCRRAARAARSGARWPG